MKGKITVLIEMKASFWFELFRAEFYIIYTKPQPFPPIISVILSRRELGLTVKVFTALCQ